MWRTLFALSFCAASVSAEIGTLSDQQIRYAIVRGMSTDAKKIWKQVRSTHRVLINRAGFDSVEKHVTFVNDSDRISLIASDRHRRRMPELTVAVVRETIPLGIIEARLEAKAGGIYTPNIAKWCAPMVHMTLEGDGQMVQPIEELSGGVSRTTILPSQTGLVSRSGSTVTYTPLYNSALYDATTGITWFKFPAPRNGGPLTVVVISADGHTKEKRVDARLLGIE